MISIDTLVIEPSRAQRIELWCIFALYSTIKFRYQIVIRSIRPCYISLVTSQITGQNTKGGSVASSMSLAEIVSNVWGSPADSSDGRLSLVKKLPSPFHGQKRLPHTQ